MKQNIFETRQRSEELMKQAIEMWQKSDQSENLEGLENDPVFKLLMNAVAYQSNELDSEIELIKTDILREFSKMVTEGEGGNAMPATTVLTMMPGKGLSVLDVNDRMLFVMRGKKNPYNFMPLLKTRLFNASVKSMERLDSRRWLVGIDFSDPVTKLTGMTLLIKNVFFHDVKIIIADNGEELPLIAPWDNSSLPMSDAFSLDTMLYNRSQAVSTGRGVNTMNPYHRNCAMDIFARQNARLYVVDEMDDIDEHIHIDLLFEFEGTTDDFSFDEKDFVMNAVIVANATRTSATLSSSKPLARIAGMANDGFGGKQFMHLLRPNADSIFNDIPVEVRHISSDRFNSGRLQKLMNNLIAKYSSDYYAFQEFGSVETDAILQRIRRDMTALSEKANKQSNIFEGVYAILSNSSALQLRRSIGLEDVSMDVSYLTTDGAMLNAELNQQTIFDGPSTILSDSIHQVVAPQQGMNEVYGNNAEAAISRYFTATEDRLVTPADIKMFCTTELMTRYGITRNLITSIRLSRQQVSQGSYTTYQSVVDITVRNTVFVQRALADKLYGVETYLQSMITVRTNGMYPVVVHVRIS